MSLKKTLSDVSILCAAIAAASIIALASAFTAQYAFGLAPCALCLYQRVPYAITAIAGFVGLIAARRTHELAAIRIALLCAVVFLAGSVIAFYHAGVEQHWWVSFLEGCKADFGAAGGDLLARIEAARAARCDEIPWADPVLHLSMAAWNAIISLGLAGFALTGCVLAARRRNGFL